MFAWLILLASFVQPWIGVYGLIGVLISNLLAFYFGFKKEEINNGLYGLNSLLTTLALAGPYQTSEHLFILIAIACLFNVFLTVTINGFFSRLGISGLSMPFLISLWLILLASRNYEALELSEGNIFLINDLYYYGGNDLIEIYQSIIAFSLPPFIDIYLKSLGAILFEYNLFAGILIAIGMIIHSRISFLLSLIGFTTGYLYYYWFQGDLNQIHYSYIGFNFILCSMAIGGFFFVANKNAILFSFLITPIVAILIGALSSVFSILQLPIYSLPFIFTVMMTLYMSHFFDIKKPFLKKVFHQNFSPEINLYNHQNQVLRFGAYFKIPLSLPFYGKWKVSQAYNGDQTHKGDWQYALDFTIENEDGHTYKTTGQELSDFYCYKLPIIAPADGTIVEVENNIEDNTVGDINMKNNWGNTVVIQVSNYLYVQLSHLLKESIIVKKGAFVNKGDIIGYLGNSGRSPEPHLHFQVQSMPYIGSKTIPYPINSFIKQDQLHSIAKPKLNDCIENVTEDVNIKQAFELQPGKKMKLNINEVEFEEWEIHTDAFNKKYILNTHDQSIAYFQTENGVFQFTSFIGEQDNFLFKFYLAMQKIVLGNYLNLTCEDIIPKHYLSKGLSAVIMDFIAPFVSISDYNYYSKLIQYDELNSSAKFNTTITNKSDKKLALKAEIIINEGLINYIDLDFESQNYKSSISYE